MRWLLLGLLLTLSACAPLVPAKTPPQLAHTPGAPVQISEQIYDAGTFQLRYPAGWRVVKLSEAGAPMTAVFVSTAENPDDALILTVSAAPIPENDAAPLVLRDVVRQGAEAVYLRASGPLERSDALREALASLRASLEVR